MRERQNEMSTTCVSGWVNHSTCKVMRSVPTCSGKAARLFERPVAYKLTVRRGDRKLQVTLTPRKLV